MGLPPVFLLAFAGACEPSRPTPPCCLNLLDELARAEVRPTNRLPDAVQVIDVMVGGDRRRSLSVRVPSRITFPVRMPEHAHFTSAIAVEPPGEAAPTSGVSFRLGISDGRTYESLLDRTILAPESSAWALVAIDLRKYAGWQWSLFYRPSSITWQIVLNSYAVGPAVETMRAVWALPAIEGRGQR